MMLHKVHLVKNEIHGLQAYLSKMLYSAHLLLPKASVSSSLLCHTLAGRRVDVLTITDGAAAVTTAWQQQQQQEEKNQKEQQQQRQGQSTNGIQSYGVGNAACGEQQELQHEHQQEQQQQRQQEQNELRHKHEEEQLQQHMQEQQELGQPKGQQNPKQVVLIMARVHPGETCASWVMQVG
jgi:hypothetical protein